MKKFTTILISILVISAISYYGISIFNIFKYGTTSKFDPVIYGLNKINQKKSNKEELTIYPEKGLYIDFSDSIPNNLFIKSDGYSNGGLYNCIWNQDTSSIKNNKLSLELRAIEDKWYCPEIVTAISFHYGRYEAAMKITDSAGTVTFFGLYAPNGDEIDIEFNGGYNDEVELNYWAKGVNSKGKIINLGFNNSEDYHVYAFDWQPNQLTFYVDDKLVWSTNYKETGAPVDTPSPIILSFWPGISSLQGWLGGYLDPANPPTAIIESSISWFKFIPYQPE